MYVCVPLYVRTVYISGCLCQPLTLSEQEAKRGRKGGPRGGEGSEGVGKKGGERGRSEEGKEGRWEERKKMVCRGVGIVREKGGERDEGRGETTEREERTGRGKWGEERGGERGV